MTFPVVLALSLRFMADQNIPVTATYGDTTVGGLSGLSFDEATGTLYAISDDKGDVNPSRFYTFSVDLGEGRLALAPTGVSLLKRADGSTYPLKTIDAEGIAFAGPGHVYVSSEGYLGGEPPLPPAIFSYDTAGTLLGSLEIPALLATGRRNRALEALTLAPGGQTLFAGMEGTLTGDGDEADFTHGADVRIVRYDMSGAAPRPAAQFAYHVEPVFKPADLPEAEADATGVSDLLALNDHELIAIERGGVAFGADGYRTHVALFHLDLTGASDVSGLPTLAGAAYKPAQKTELLDLNDVMPVLSAGFQTIDNIEGITFGPTLANGHRTLLLISDDNFSDTQRTQVLAFELIP